MPEEDDLSDGPVPATPAPPPLSDAEAAAVMVMLLGDDQAGRILAQLDPTELQLLGEKMCALGDISPESIIHSITGFVERTEKLGIRADGRVDHVRKLMTNAIGDVKAENMMARILPDEPQTSSLELARWLNANAIAPLVRGEQPQQRWQRHCRRRN